jgi:hypothetical protein
MRQNVVPSITFIVCGSQPRIVNVRNKIQRGSERNSNSARCTLQLENAQKEIFRAQDIIDQVASQRNEAEAEAVKARTKARRLQEVMLGMLAREEGRRMGYKEGLSIGRRIGYDEGSRRLTGLSDQPPHHPLSPELHGGNEGVLEFGDATTDEERDDPRSHVQLRSGASFRQQPYVNDCVGCSLLPTLITECAPNQHRLYVHSKLPHMRRRFLSHRALFLSVSTSLLMGTARPPRFMNSMNQKPFIRYRYALARSHQRPLDDGWIPRADSRTSYIT